MKKIIILFFTLFLIHKVYAQSTTSTNSWLANRFIGFDASNGTNPLYFRTNNINRMKLNGIISYNVNGYNQSRDGSMLLSNNPGGTVYQGTSGFPIMNTATFGAYSLLHLVGDDSPNIQTSGYRGWIRNGIIQLISLKKFIEGNFVDL